MFEVHGVSHVSPGFRLVPSCQCPRHFGGPSCDQARNICATVSCKSPRICVPPWTPGMEHVCVCAPPWNETNCELLARPINGAKSCFTETCYQQRGIFAFLIALVLIVRRRSNLKYTPLASSLLNST